MSLDLLDVDFSATTDASGNATIALNLRKAFYAVGNVVAQVTGNTARWSVLVNQRLWKPGRGSTADMGPILIQPTDAVAVNVTGALPNAQVTGKLAGLTATTLHEALQHYSPAPNLVALETLSNEQQIDFFTQAPNTVVTNRSYVLPAGTQNVRVQVNENGQVVTFANYKVVGATTGITYVFPGAAAGSSGGFDNWFKPAPPDTAILFSLDTTGSANGVEVIITADLAMNFVEVNMVGNGTASGSPILVENTTAAPWQAPNLPPQLINVTIAGAGGTAPILAAAAGKTVYIFSCSIGIDAAQAGAISLQDTAGVTYHTFETSGALILNPLLGCGVPFPVGVGVRLSNPLANPMTVRGSLVASQA